MDVVYLDFSKASDTTSRNIIIDELTKYRLDNQTVKWIENWQNKQA